MYIAGDESLLVGNGIVADQDFLTADWDEDDFD